MLPAAFVVVALQACYRHEDDTLPNGTMLLLSCSHITPILLCRGVKDIILSGYEAAINESIPQLRRLLYMS